MNKKCLACGIEKDIDLHEIYPYPDDCITTEELIEPLIELECQMDNDCSDFRIATVCFDCFHKLEPDMWISESMWESLNPLVSAKELTKKD